MKAMLILGLAAMLAFSQPAMAAGHGVRYTVTSHSVGSKSAVGHSSGSHVSHSKPHVATAKSVKMPKASHANSKAQGVQRDSHGKIARSEHAKTSFKKQHPCPSTGKTSGACSGYLIDHVKPLKRGGADAPSNMQWQNKAAAKQKDKTE